MKGFFFGALVGVIFGMVGLLLIMSVDNINYQYSKALDFKDRDVYACIYAPNVKGHMPRGWAYCGTVLELVYKTPEVVNFLEAHKDVLEDKPMDGGTDNGDE